MERTAGVPQRLLKTTQVIYTLWYLSTRIRAFISVVYVTTSGFKSCNYGNPNVFSVRWQDQSKLKV